MDYYSILVVVTGMFLASFYNVVGIRVPNKQTIMGRSECPNCHQTLRWFDIIPIIGYLINRGRCHFCKQSIDVKYILVEILGGGLLLLFYVKYGFTIDFLILTIVFSVLMIETISDIHYFEVIDLVWAIGLLPLVIIRIFEGQFLEYLLSAGVLFAFMLALALIARKITKKEALGGGDVKLFIFIGFALTLIQGFLSLSFASFVGFIYGMLVRKRAQKEIPLVPFLFGGVMVAYLWGAEIIAWYLNLLGM